MACGEICATFARLWTQDLPYP